ncbi:MAG: ATP-binding protein [Synergistaceae bacterium]|jgi:hypothetical protein|nr:ATP-binding protein [Synergistaceae bacterium]
MMIMEPDSKDFAADFETVSVLIEKRNEYAKKTINECNAAINALGSNYFVDIDLIKNAAEQLKEYEDIQGTLCKVLGKVLPGYETKNFTDIQGLLIEQKNNDDELRQIRNTLEKFLLVSSGDNVDSKAILDENKIKVKSLLEERDVNFLRTEASPYHLFLKLTENHQLISDISVKEEEMIEKEFPKPIPRYLYAGYFFLANTLPANEVQKQNLDFTTAKESTPFHTTPFVHEMAKKINNVWKFIPPFSNLHRKFLLTLASLWVLSEDLIGKYIFEKQDVKESLKKFIKEGYLTVITDAKSKSAFYAFSPKGLKMFAAATSREMLMSRGDKIPSKLLSSQELKSRQEILSDLIRINSIVLFLMRIAKRDAQNVKKMIFVSEWAFTPEGTPCLIFSREIQNHKSIEFFVISYCNGQDSAIAEKVPQKTDKGDLINNVILICENIVIAETMSSQLTKVCPWQRLFTVSIDRETKKLFLYEDGEKINFLSLLSDTYPNDNSNFPDAIGITHKETSQPRVQEAKIENIERKTDIANRVETLDASGDSPVNTSNAALVASVLKSESEFLIPEKTDDENDKDAKEVTEIEEFTQSETIAANNAREKAGDILSSGLTPKHTEEFVSLCDMLLQEGIDIQDDDIVVNSLTQAVVLMKSLSLEENYPQYHILYKQLLLATDFPLDPHTYDSNSIFAVFNDGDKRSVFSLATILRAIFSPDMSYDHPLYEYAKDVFSDFETIFEKYGALKPLFNLLLQVKDLSPTGFSDSVLNRFTDQSKQKEKIKKLREEASQLVELPVIKKMINGIPDMLDLCFGAKSDLRTCLEIISKDKTDEIDFVKSIYEKFCNKNIDGFQIVSADKIELEFDKNWKIARKEDRMLLIKAPREKILEGFKKRIDLIDSWLNIIKQNNNTGKRDNESLLSLRSKIIKELDLVLPFIKETYGPFDKTVLVYLLDNIKKKLSGETIDRRKTFADMLRSGFFSVDENGLPVIMPKLSSVPYFEPWRNVLKHIAAPVIGLRETLLRVSDKAYPDFYDNIGAAQAICRYLSDYCEEIDNSEKYTVSIPDAKKSANQRTDDFKNDLEIAFAYGRISESQREELLDVVDEFEEDFLSANDFGIWNGFLNALRKNIGDNAQTRHKELDLDITDRRKNNKRDELTVLLDIAAEKLRAPEKNFALAEEYINYFDIGYIEDLEHIAIEEKDTNPFLKFISKNVYDDLLNLCRRNQARSLRGFGWNYTEERLKQSNVSEQYREGARRLLCNLPNQPKEARPESIQQLLTELGFVVEKVTPGQKNCSFKALIKPDQKDKTEYLHPVDIMGTKLCSPVDIIFLFGKMQPNDIVDRICGYELSQTAIVFLNGTLDLPARRQIAERFHTEKSGHNPFLLVDWVLLLFLATYQKTERLPVLLNCTLPYTSSFQPFVTSGAVSDEMFIGRKQELGQILNPNGPVIVYGGRQLGKTALLERALSRAHHPQKKEYAFYINAIGCKDEAKLAEKILTELSSAGLDVTGGISLENICGSLKKQHQEQRWSRLLLMIDEADSILETFKMSAPSYSNLNAFADLRRATNNNFKFVLAGLHNVCRVAQDSNTVFGQLGGPLCIKPLSSFDARNLLTKPLRYLGFSLDNAYLEHILVNTIFYPGIIHFVGYKIVDNLSIKYSDYYRASNDNPPYDLTDKQLGSIMNSADLNNSINDRIKWTLEVDPRYFMLARCIAYLYYTDPEKNKNGYSVEEILEYAQLLEISCLNGINSGDCKTLLMEMVEMGILVTPSSMSFRLRRRRFLEVIGKDTYEIENEIKRLEAENRNAL